MGGNYKTVNPPPGKTLGDALSQRMILHSTDAFPAKRDFVELAVDLTKRGGFVEV